MAGWKMAMTISESLAFAQAFRSLTADCLGQVAVCLFPPYTSLWALSQVLRGSGIELGGQNMADSEDPARSGQISGKLLADAGARWVQLGHWEVRRHLGDDDARVNRKVLFAFAAGLVPVLLVGEERGTSAPLADELGGRLERTLAGCRPDQVGSMAIMYEPEAAIGLDEPAAFARIGEGSGFIRRWVRDRFGGWAGESVRILYGGSVSPESAHRLMACSELDGLGATRSGRDPVAFARIVSAIGSAGRGKGV
jgi:triosephosphate isomerase (TIM)